MFNKLLSHGNASVESGFSINKELLIENLNEKTVVCQRRVYDAIFNAGGVLSTPIDIKLLQSVRAARMRYENHMQEVRQRLREEEEKVLESKKLQSEVKRSRKR